MTVVIEPRKGGIKILGSGGGGKGGGASSRTPVEFPDSAHNTTYAVLLDAIGNGEMYGPAHPAQPLRDIYLDGTPVQNPDGSLNFPDIQVDVRHGTQDQEHIPGFPAASNTTSVGVQVTTTSPWTQLVTNPDLSALRITLFWPRLVQIVETGQNAGDRVGTRVEYAIDLAVGGGSFVNVLTASVDDKSVNGYARTHRVELPSSGIGWTVRVRRITPDPTSSLTENAMSVQSYAEVIDGKFRYPMTALVGIKINAEKFQSIPTRAYHWRGEIIRVPSNYDPENRTYSGVWDGSFKRAWSDNPAWIFFDILTSPLYGLGDRINLAMIDRYALYQIGAYCDQMVSDGMGGTEPRFICATYIQSQQDALRVINDLASVFRGMSYWANGEVVSVADMPKDPVYTYTNSKVKGGRFEYTGPDRTTRKTVALVSWNDPSDFYRSKVEVVNDDDGIQLFGIRQISVKGFGLKSRGQAQRVGLYQLYTSRLDDGGVSFSVGLDGVIPQPGDIAKVADRNRAGRPIGGLISQATLSSVTIDRESPINPGDIITVNLPTGISQSRTVSLVSGRILSVSAPFTMTPSPEASWSVAAPDLVEQPIRIYSVKEVSPVEYKISATFHHPGKFAAIDDGVRLDPLPVSVVPPRVQDAPNAVLITSHHTFYQGTTRHTAEISWDKPENAVAYDIQWRRDNGDWITVPRTGSRLVELTDVYQGNYIARVRALNGLDVPSLWRYSELTHVAGIIGDPPTVAFLNTIGEVMAIRLQWGYKADPNIVERAEIRASQTNDFADSYLLTSVAYPGTNYTLYNLAYSAEFWFWIRLVDKNGTAGAWFPSNTGAGVFGIPDQSPLNILSYLEGQIGEGQLAPGLIEEITEDVANDLLDEITGELTGDNILDEKWYAGDDGEEGVFVGTVTTTSAYNAGDYYEAKRTTSLVAQVDSSLAIIREVQTVQANTTSALASQVTTLTANVGTLGAVVEQTSTALASLDGAVSSSWQVKTQVRADGRVVQAGVAVGASVNPNGTSRSEILLMADTIAFLNTLNGQLHAPFIFDVANDTAFLNTVFIQNATIAFAKIANDIQSSNYVANQTGWRLDKNGNFFNNGSGTGWRTVQTSQRYEIYDSVRLRIRLGNW